MRVEPANRVGERVARDVDVGVQHELVVGAGAVEHQVVRDAVADVRVAVQEVKLHARVGEAQLAEAGHFVGDLRILAVVDERERDAAHDAFLARGADRERELAQAALEQRGVRPVRNDADRQRRGEHEDGVGHGRIAASGGPREVESSENRDAASIAMPSASQRPIADAPQTAIIASLSRNDELFARAQRTIPAGVNSPVRAFRSVGGTPRFFARGEGAYLWDADGKRYIDYVGSWGPAILGHAHPDVVRAVVEAAAKGLSFGAPTETEIEMAEKLCRLVPSIELVRLVSSGTEATMSALRLARGFTGRSAIVKFEGCYHGHGDSLLVKAGSGALTFGQPSSAGVPPAIAGETLVLPYNDLDAVETAFKADGARIAVHHRRARRRAT